MSAAAVASPTPFGRAGAVLAAVFFGITWAHRRMTLVLRSITEQMGLLPHTITFDQNDDGTVTAFVSRLNGEPIIVRIPEQVAEQGHDAVAHYLMHELNVDDVDVVIHDDE